MKSKIFKIMGVTLALVLTFTVGAAFMPANTVDKAEAATLAWSGVDIPSLVNNVLVTNINDLGPVDVSPNFASDNTVFAIVNPNTLGAVPIVYKSTDGGHHWIPWAAAPTGLAAGDVGIALVLSPNYANDSTVFFASQTPLGGATTGRVYRSTNGGISYGQLGVVALAASERITGMDVSPDYDGTGLVVVGVANIITSSVATAANSVQVWGLNAVLSWTSWGAAVNTDVSAVKFSPSYAIDNTLLTVTSDIGGGMATTNPYLRGAVLGVWDTLVTAVLVNATGVTAVQLDFASQDSAVGNEILMADIAIPSDYNAQVPTTQRAYVTIVNMGGAGTELGNVYRITGATAGVEITNTLAVQLSNLDYNGTFAEGTLVGGLWGCATAADVYRTTNPATSVVNWYGVAQLPDRPTGGTEAGTVLTATDNSTAWVRMSPNFATDSTVIVGTLGWDSAFGASTDGAVSFNERGLIDNAGVNIAQLGDIALSPDFATDSTIFLISGNLNALSANDTNVWVTYDGGLNWDRCFTFNTLAATAGIALIAVSQEFATDSSVYIGDFTGTAVWYSADGGKAWSARSVAAALAITIQTMAAPNATTVYAGDAGSGNVAKSTNSGWTWPSAAMSNSGAGQATSLEVIDSTVLVGGNAGTVRRSDDGGVTYSLVGNAITGGGNMYAVFDGTTVWVASNGTAGQVYRSEAGGAFVPLTMPLAATSWSVSPALAIDLILAGDGTLYELDSTAVVAATVGPPSAGRDSVFRSINPTAAEPTPGTTFEAMLGTVTDRAWNLDVAPAAVSGNTVVKLIDAGGGTVADTVHIYSDTLSAGIAPPKLVSPADGSTLATGTATRFTIETIQSVTAYTVWWSTDPTLYSAVTVCAIAAPGVQTAVQTLTEGYTVYWMARATAPFIGPWSEVWSVSTQLTQAVNAPSLVSPGSSAGSTVDVAINPVLNWSAFKYANGYEMQMANDAAMTDFIADLTGANALGNVTSWKCTTTLGYNTTYFWRVRAILGTATTYSDWSNVVGFTTMAKPVAPAPPVIIEPTPPAPAPVEPTTPAYIWGIIAIGAVLVIVVIVLIVRTRRTV